MQDEWRWRGVEVMLEGCCMLCKRGVTCYVVKVLPEVHRNETRGVLKIKVVTSD